MRYIRVLIAAALMTFSVAAVGASNALKGQKGADGGNGLSNGMPGCRGGTDPSADGKFYIPGGKRECNPGSQDRKKVQ